MMQFRYNFCSRWLLFTYTHANSRTRHCTNARSMMYWSLVAVTLL